MGRGRGGQLLVAAGVIVLVAASFAFMASRGVRDTDAFRDAAPDLLEISTVHDAVADELARAIGELYAPVELSEQTLAGAAERMVENGYVIDDFQAALEVAHRGWAEYAAPIEVQLDEAVATQTALTALRDVDPAAADDFPPGGVVTPGPVVLPIGTTLDRLVDLQSPALLAMAGGAVLALLGAVIDRQRNRTLKNLARGICTASLLAVLAAFVLPLGPLRDLSPVVGVLGAIAGQHTGLLVVVAVVMVVVGLSLHASADRIVSEVSRTVRTVQTARETAPVRSGSRRTRRAGKARNEAIDAFFGDGTARRDTTSEAPADEDEHDPLGDPDDLQLPVAAGAEEPAGEDPDGTPGPGEAGDDARGDADEPRPKTPEQERAEALAAERKEALERIDGTRSRYRTHLRR